MAKTFEILRTLASYRVDFDGLTHLDPEVIAKRIADIFHAFPGVTELRAVAGGAVSVYVSIPYEVDPEKLDAKARDLWAKWEEQHHTPPA